MVMEENQTPGGEHTTEYVDVVSQCCAPEIYIYLTNVTSKYSFKNYFSYTTKACKPKGGKYDRKRNRHELDIGSIRQGLRNNYE